MRKNEKVEIVNEFVGIFTKPGVYLMDFKGLNVAQITELRDLLYESKISMRVVKNTLAKRALKEVGIQSLDSYFFGPTGVIWSEEDSITPARLLLEFVKKHNKGIVKAGLVEGAMVPENQIETVSKLPTKKELQAKLAGTLNAPIVKLARVLNALPTKLARTIDALEKKKAGEIE